MPGQRLSDLKPNQHFGYGVDSATGCFIDAAALDTETYQFERGAADQLVTAMSRYPVKGGLCGVIPVRRWGGPTLVGFSTGLGDGFYSSYWGFDAAGHLVTLDSDFGLLTEAVHAEAVFEGIAGRLGEMLQDPRMRRLGFSVRVPRTAGRAKPLTVVQEGSASGLSVRFVIGGDIFTRRASTHQEGRVTHVYEITRDRLTPEASLQLEFVEGFKPLQPSAAVRP